MNTVSRTPSYALGLGFLASTAPARADVVVGPQVSYYFDNSNLRTSHLSGAADAQAILSLEAAPALSKAELHMPLWMEPRRGG